MLDHCLALVQTVLVSDICLVDDAPLLASREACVGLLGLPGWRQATSRVSCLLSRVRVRYLGSYAGRELSTWVR